MSATAAVLLVVMVASVPQVEIKVYLHDQPQLVASVPVNGTVELAGAGGIKVGGEIAQEHMGGDVSYSLEFTDAGGNRDAIFVRAPFETCTQQAVDLGVRYVVRLCGAFVEARGNEHG